MNLSTHLIAVILSVTPATGRAPVPAEADRAEARESLRTLFERGSPSALEALALKLFAIADAEGADSAERWVALEDGIDVAARAGRADLAVSGVEILVEAFAVDDRQVRLEAFIKAADSARTSAARQTAAEALFSVAESALGGDDFESATRAAESATAVTRVGVSALTRKRAREVANRVKACRKAYRAIADDIDRLATFPNDPGANLALGLYRCFTKGDWENGREVLAKSSIGPLRLVVTHELKAGNGPRELEALAEEWRKLASDRTLRRRRDCGRRAVFWYVRSIRRSSGIELEKARRRLASILSSLDLYVPGNSELHLSFDRAKVTSRKDETYFKDLSGHGRHAVLRGELESCLVAGRVGEALHCDGRGGSAVVLASRDPIGGGRAVSVSCWMHPETPGKLGFIFDAGFYANNSITIHQKDGIHFNLPEFGRSHSISAPGPLESRWYHVVGTWDGEVQQLWIDGELAGEIPLENAEALPKFGEAWIGGQSERPDRGRRFFHGLIDEVTLHARELEPNEIEALYLYGLAGERP